MKKSFMILSSLGAVVILLLSFVLYNEEGVLVESIESKTSEGMKVFNRIQLVSTVDKDTWLMKQNHSDLVGEWDELKIEVDKKEKPFKAYYYQMKNGVQKNFRVACFKCHINGPRAIRANFNSTFVKNTYFEKLKILMWNFKIKHYGNIQTPQNVKIYNEFRKIPLKYVGRKDNTTISSKTCNYCHGESSFMGRANLLYQQKETIKHLISNGEMPPWPFSMSKKEKNDLLKSLL
jgi:hypothetical protein